jgi:hypothetical protein
MRTIKRDADGNIVRIDCADPAGAFDTVLPPDPELRAKLAHLGARDALIASAAAYVAACQLVGAPVDKAGMLEHARAIIHDAPR